MNRTCMTMFISFLLFACGDMSEDKSAEEACKNVTCPVGSTISLSAESVNACRSQGKLNPATQDFSGQCYTKGSCIYACMPPRPCCKNEQWTLTSYSCEEPCS